MLDVAPDDETAAEMIAALVGRRGGGPLADAEDLDAATEEAQAVAETAVREASAADRDLVQDATQRAVGAALRAYFEAEIADENADADYDTEAARAAADRQDDGSASLGLLGSVALD